MTPQSCFTVLAPLREGAADELRALLASMTCRPGAADPHNALVPFGELERLHFARFVVLEAPTAGDIAAYGVVPAPWPVSLAFLGDCDGPAESFLAELVARAGPGLRRIFGFCRGLSEGEDLLAWMRRHEHPASANYVNWIGRTVRQVREEQALHQALLDHLQDGGAATSRREAPLVLRDRLLRLVETEQKAGRLTLSPEAPTPMDWRLRNAAHKVGVPLALLLLAPFLLVASPLLAYRLRAHETSDPDLDFHPESPAAQLDRSGDLPQIPAVPTQLEALTASVTGILSHLAELPLPELVADLRQTVQGVQELVASPDTRQGVAALSASATRLQALLATLDQQLGPLLSRADATLASTQGLVGDNSQLRYDIADLLRELTGAARSIRVFADYLERHPEALIRGKGGAQ